MAVDPVVQDFIARSMAENNRSLMSEISTLITNSVESIKHSTESEAVEDQLRGSSKSDAKNRSLSNVKEIKYSTSLMLKSKILLTRPSRTSNPTPSTKPKNPWPKVRLCLQKGRNLFS